ncbi:MAG: MFS transporter [Thermomicrobiales bacterium]
MIPSRSAGASRIPLFALLAANAVSMTGNVFTLIAIPWFVLQTTGSASQTGLTSAVAALPFVIAGVFGGALVDRVGFRRMSVIADLASSVTTALIPLLHLTIGLEFWQLLVLVFLGGLLDTPGTTARAALLPDLAELAGMRLERVNAIEQMVQRGSYMLGAPLAGVVIAATSTTSALWFNAASFIVSAAIVAIFIPAAVAKMVEANIDLAPDGNALSRYVADLGDGLRFIRRDPLILAIVIGIAVTNFLDAMVGLIYPVYAERVFGSAFDLGILMAASGGGAVLTTLAFAAVGHRLPRRETYIGCFVLSAVMLFPLALTPPLLICAFAMIGKGVGAGPLNPILMTVGQERIPAEMRGRVLGVLTSLAWIAIPAGRLGSGYLIEGFGLIPTLLVVASAYVAVTLSMLLVPALRLMDAPSPIMKSAGIALSTMPQPPRTTVAEGRN